MEVATGIASALTQLVGTSWDGLQRKIMAFSKITTLEAASPPKSNLSPSGEKKAPEAILPLRISFPRFLAFCALMTNHFVPTTGSSYSSSSGRDGCDQGRGRRFLFGFSYLSIDGLSCLRLSLHASLCQEQARSQSKCPRQFHKYQRPAV